MKTLKKLYELKREIEKLEEQYQAGVAQAEADGRLEETSEGITYRLVIAEYLQESVNPEKLYENLGKKMIPYVAVNTGQIKKALGENVLEGCIDDLKPRKTRRIMVK